MLQRRLINHKHIVQRSKLIIKRNMVQRLFRHNSLVVVMLPFTLIISMDINYSNWIPPGSVVGLHMTQPRKSISKSNLTQIFRYKICVFQDSFPWFSSFCIHLYKTKNTKHKKSIYHYEYHLYNTTKLEYKIPCMKQKYLLTFVDLGVVCI